MLCSRLVCGSPVLALLQECAPCFSFSFFTCECDCSKLSVIFNVFCVDFCLVKLQLGNPQTQI